MTLRQLIILILAATLLLWAGWSWTLFVIDPDATNWLGFLFFYAIFFLAMTGTMALAGLFLRQKRGTDMLLYHLVRITFRQGLLLSTLLTALLILQGMRWLSSVAMAVLFVGTLALELFLAWRFSRTQRRVAGVERSGKSIPASAVFSSPDPTFAKRELSEIPLPPENETTAL
jgi:hypothetical protein